MRGRPGGRPVEDVDGVGLGRRVEDEVDDEIAFHLDARTEELIAAGASRREARAQALEEFGGVGDARREMGRRTRRRRRWRGWRGWLGDLVQDVRFAVRGVKSAPGLYAVALLSLALGMAAVSTMWTALDRLILRPLPYDQDRTLVYVGTADGGRGRASNPMAAGDFLDLSAAARTVRLAAYQSRGANLGGDPPEWVTVRQVTPGYLSVLTVPPILGRNFLPEDGDRGAPDVAILDHGVWERRFGADPGIVGRSVSMDGEPAMVVGVLPPRFQFGYGSADVLVPLALVDDGVRDSWSVNVVGRLRQKGGLAATRGELSALAEGMKARFPATHDERTFPVNEVLSELNAGPQIAQGLGGSLGAAFFVLLIACANVANLLLARGTARGGEMALRRALGAGRGRIARQLLTEAMLLAGMGGALGVAVSATGIRAVATLAPPDMPRAGELFLDGRGVLMCMSIAAVSVLLFGVIPALRTLSLGERRRLADGPRGAGGRGGRRLRSLLVAGELGLAAALVTTTILAVRSVQGIQRVDTGFDTENVWTFRVTLPTAAYPDEEALAVGTDRLRAAMLALPGVTAAGSGLGLPGRGWRSLPYRVPGADDDEPRPRVLARIAEPEYLRTIGLGPSSGRGLEADDGADSELVGLVNESFSRRLWGGDDPLGRGLVVDGRMVTVVGVVPAVHELGTSNDPRDAIYLPLAQWPQRPLSVVLKSDGAPLDVKVLQAAVSSLDGDVAVRDVSTFESVLFQTAGGFTAMSKLLGVMASAALLLAIFGVYAATSYAVARREPEIGVRMAVGADRWSVRAMVIREVGLMSLVGLLIGLPLAWGAGRGLSSYIVGSATSEPTPYVLVAVLLLSVSVAAGWAPARRASAVDPMRALREE